LVHHRGLILAKRINFGCQNWSGWMDFGSKSGLRGPVLAGISAKIGKAGPILGVLILV